MQKLEPKLYHDETCCPFPVPADRRSLPRIHCVADVCLGEFQIITPIAPNPDATFRQKCAVRSPSLFQRVVFHFGRVRLLPSLPPWLGRSLPLPVQDTAFQNDRDAFELSTFLTPDINLGFLAIVRTQDRVRCI